MRLACMQVWNPAFDVTPADLITGIITEQGPISKSSGGTFEVAALLSSADPPATRSQNGHATAAALQLNGHAHTDQQASFHALNVDTVKSYLAGIPHLAARLGPADGHAAWQVRRLSLLLLPLNQSAQHSHYLVPLCQRMHMLIGPRVA